MNIKNAIKCLSNYPSKDKVIIYRRFRDSWDNHVYLTIGYLLPDYTDIPDQYKNKPFFRQFNDDGENLGGSFELHPEYMKGNNWKLLKGTPEITPEGPGISFNIPFKTTTYGGAFITY